MSTSKQFGLPIQACLAALIMIALMTLTFCAGAAFQAMSQSQAWTSTTTAYVDGSAALFMGQSSFIAAPSPQFTGGQVKA